MTLRSVVVKKKFAQPSKSLTVLWAWLSPKLSVAFQFLICFSTLIVENSYILPGIYIIFLENVLHHTWNAFNTEFGRLKIL